MVCFSILKHSRSTEKIISKLYYTLTTNFNRLCKKLYSILLFYWYRIKKGCDLVIYLRSHGHLFNDSDSSLSFL